MRRNLQTALAAGVDVVAVEAAAVDAMIAIRVRKRVLRPLRRRKHPRYRWNQLSSHAQSRPLGYAPIVLPGESISKYRNLTPAGR